jgi:hypothetical protein
MYGEDYNKVSRISHMVSIFCLNFSMQIPHEAVGYCHEGSKKTTKVFKDIRGNSDLFSMNKSSCNVEGMGMRLMASTPIGRILNEVHLKAKQLWCSKDRKRRKGVIGNIDWTW